MTFYRTCSYGLLALLLVACSTTSTQPSAPGFAGKTSQSSKLSLADTTQEFVHFYQRFCRDTAYQKAHVVFPFPVTLYGIAEDETERTFISGTAWKHRAFAWNDSIARRQADTFTQELVQYGDTVLLEIRGVESGIMVEYGFVRKSGSWFMAWLADSST